MEISGARNLKSLDENNRKLMKLLAESRQVAATLRQMLGKTSNVGLRWKAVTWAISELRHSQRRACGLVGLHPVHYLRRGPAAYKRAFFDRRR